MNHFNFCKSFAYLLIVTCLFSCFDPAKDEANDEVEEPGFGISSKRPVGTPFNFPAGVTLEGGMVHTPDFCISNDSLPFLLNPITRETIYGTPGYFIICMTLTNSNSIPITIRCPAGLTFISQKDSNGRLRTQNGIIISDLEITIAGGITQSFLLDLYCLNNDRSRPGGNESFEVGPVTENKGMKNLIAQLRNKRISNQQLGTEWVYVLTWIQAAIWDITAGEEISPATQKELDKL